jgi:diguanylate cyclase (GGDEF)-like protein/PAS domain S-box-containing protein
MIDRATKTILLVEDEPIIALMEVRQLEKEGYTVIHADNGNQAIDMIQEKRDQIDLILMDIDLGPGIDGTQTAKEILKHHDIPIVFLSARVEKEVVQKTEKITSYGYVVKNSGIIVIDASIKMAFKLYEANKKTERQRERLGTILHSIGDAVMATDTKGNIVQMNPVAEQLTGWKFNEANGMPLQEVFHIVNASTRKKVISPVELVLASGKIVGLANDTVLVSKDGNEYKISDSGSPIKDSDGTITGVVLVFKDITKEYEIQSLLKQSELHLRTIVEATPSCVKLVARDGTLLAMNSAGLAMIEIDNPEKVIGKNVYSMVAPEYRETFKKFNESICNGEKGSLQFQIIGAKGSRVWLESHAVPLPSQRSSELVQLAITHDITEKKRNEDSLKESEQLYHAIFEKSQAVKLLIDPSDGTIVDANSAAVEFYGYPLESLKKIKINDINILSQEKIKEEIEKASDEKRAYFNFRHRLANGSFKDVEVYSSPLTVGGRILLHSIIHDISDRKKIEAALGENERNIKILLDTMTEGVALNEIIYDDNGEMIDYKIVNVNRAFYSTADYSKVEVIGNVATQLYGMSKEDIKSFWRGHQSMKTTVFTEMWSPLHNKCYFVATSPFIDDKFVTTFLDITERKNAETALAEFNRDFENFLKETTDFIYFKDKDSRFRFCSQSLANITGHAHWQDMIGKHDLEVFPADTAKIYHEEELPIFEKGTPILGKIDPYYDSEGNIGYVSTNKWPLFDSKRNVVGIFGISRDITESKRMEEQLQRTKLALENANTELEKLSNTDSLTGIGNRRYFEKIFEKECFRSRRNNNPLSILIIDIDDFKSYNDHFGHLAGDECLKIVAKTIMGLARRAPDLAARWGGEEFIVLLPETNLSEAWIVAENIRSSVQELAIDHPVARAANVVTVSIGVATWGYEEAHELISRADKALYAAKNKGRNQVEISS